MANRDFYRSRLPRNKIEEEIYMYMRTLAYHGAVLADNAGSPWQVKVAGRSSYNPEGYLYMVRIGENGEETGRADVFDWAGWNGYSLEKLRAEVSNIQQNKRLWEQQMAAQAEVAPTPEAISAPEAVTPTTAVAPTGGAIAPATQMPAWGASREEWDAYYEGTEQQIGITDFGLTPKLTPAQQILQTAQRSYEGIPLLSDDDLRVVLSEGYHEALGVIPEHWNQMALDYQVRQRQAEQVQLGALPPEQWQEQWTQGPGGQRPLTWPQTPNWAERWGETRGDVWPTARRIQQGYADMGGLIAQDPMAYGLEKGLAPSEVQAAQQSPWASEINLKGVNQWIQGGRQGPSPWSVGVGGPPPGWTAAQNYVPPPSYGVGWDLSGINWGALGGLR